MLFDVFVPPPVVLPITCKFDVTPVTSEANDDVVPICIERLEPALPETRSPMKRSAFEV